ncbi:MAG: sigma-70 family RNA polymerase sigma factor [Acidobacteria bacterium]|nr:sigma-70 family RNA polymerase sigma factor [Acidobacteriota bacterium]
MKIVKTGMRTMAEQLITVRLDETLQAGDAAAPSDALLIERLKACEEEAYETLLARFQQPIYNLVYRLMNDPADTSDVVQEVFLKVFRSIDHFRGQSTLKTWIYRIAINEAYNHRRWFSRHKRQEVALETEEEATRPWLESISDPARDPYELALNLERHRLIEQALREINSDFRAAVILRDLEDMSYDEIAEVLEISLGTVKSRILRGRDSLRRVLATQMDPKTAESTLGFLQGAVK